MLAAFDQRVMASRRQPQVSYTSPYDAALAIQRVLLVCLFSHLVQQSGSCERIIDACFVTCVACRAVPSAALGFVSYVIVDPCRTRSAD